MFGNKKLKQRIFDLEIKLQKEREEYKSKSGKALNQLYALAVKPKYKVGQKIWGYRYSPLGYTYTCGVVANVSICELYGGELAYHYRLVSEEGIDFSINEYGAYKTKPKKCR